MKPSSASISSESIIINNKEYTVIGVSSSPNSFGICNTTRQKERGLRESFFIGHEALINVIQKSVNDKFSNKILCQISTMERCGDFSKRVTVACTDYFENNKNVTAALQPITDYLKNGLYVVYENEMFPTDGGGNFFWSSYMVSHEFGGSATFSPVCRLDYDVPPAFLVPTEGMATFSEKALSSAMEKVNRDEEAVGICFHLTGMFCALLSNHHNVTAALLQNKKVRCLVIEPIKHILSANEFAHDDNANINENDKFFYTSCAKIPLSKVPQPLLETFFMTREYEVGKYTDSIFYNSEKPSHLKGKKVLPKEITDKCDKLPDCEMIQSAAMISYLSDEAINALLQGDTTLNDNYIINQNYYSSITIALAYLQYKNFAKFLDFASAILRNEDLTAVHQYVATRLQPIMNEKISDLFHEILDSENPVYSPIRTLAEKYVKRYKAYTEAPVEKSITFEAPLKRNLENEINSLEMAKRIQSTKSGKK
ncbi:MAG: hypothetical protein NC394_00920 [Bacteroides sp.]|nr:hypothetical protein [Bacteroides sp.]